MGIYVVGGSCSRVRGITFESSKISNDGHDPFAGGIFHLFAQEGADMGQLVEHGEGNVAAQEPGGGCRLFFDER